MRQELVFIGQGLNQAKMTRALDNCLLSEEELLKGKGFLEEASGSVSSVWEEGT